MQRRSGSANDPANQQPRKPLILSDLCMDQQMPLGYWMQQRPTVATTVSAPSSTINGTVLTGSPVSGSLGGGHTGHAAAFATAAEALVDQQFLRPLSGGMASVPYGYPPPGMHTAMQYYVMAPQFVPGHPAGYGWAPPTGNAHHDTIGPSMPTHLQQMQPFHAASPVSTHCTSSAWLHSSGMMMSGGFVAAAGSGAPGIPSSSTGTAGPLTTQPQVCTPHSVPLFKGSVPGGDHCHNAHPASHSPQSECNTASPTQGVDADLSPAPSPVGSASVAKNSAIRSFPPPKSKVCAAVPVGALTSALPAKPPVTLSLMEVPVYQCRFCDYSSRASASVAVHERRHTGEKPFSCRFCSYVAARKGQVTVHERTHTDERPYKCPECAMSFKVSSALLVHSRLHSGERPYKYVTSTCANVCLGRDFVHALVYSS